MLLKFLAKIEKQILYLGIWALHIVLGVIIFARIDQINIIFPFQLSSMNMFHSQMGYITSPENKYIVTIKRDTMR